LEQKLAALELAVTAVDATSQPSAEELGSLETVERLLSDCRSLLSAEPTPITMAQPSSQEDAYAA